MTNFVAGTFHRLIAPMKLKFSQKVTLCSYSERPLFSNDHSNERPLVAILGVLFGAAIT